MKYLNGSDLAGFIRIRQQRQVSVLDHRPTLAIVQCQDKLVINTYVRLKQRYGDDIGVKVEHHQIKQAEAPALIEQLNEDSRVDGIIVQLPLPDPTQTDEIVNLIDQDKDVDALGEKSKFTAPTPTAILWLLAGYNIDLRRKNILVIGLGRLVGSPLVDMLNKSSISITTADETTKDLKKLTLAADIIITAVGQPGLLRPDVIKAGAVVVDAGATSEAGRILGDVSPEVYQRDDLTITPPKGGVGPLTVCALFENVILAASPVTIKPSPRSSAD